jgi:L-threonylcarbamoyladenylate synthase
MTIKHYAPRTPLELFDHDRQLLARSAELLRQGKRVTRLPHEPNIESLAHSLFAQLRKLDTEGADVILCVLPPPEGLGLAVRDRLQRAAGRVHE